MTVTELATAQLNPGVSPEDPGIFSALAKCKKVMEDFTGCPFHYLQQVGDSTIFYILGEWLSVENHYRSFIGTKTCNSLVSLLNPYMTVQSLYHIDVEKSTLPLDAPIIVIGRPVVARDKIDQFKTHFTKVKPILDNYVTWKQKTAGGWRIEKREDGDGEFVLFSGWNSIEEHMGWPKSEAFEGYRPVMQYLNGVDVKHAKVLSLQEGCGAGNDRVAGWKG